MARREADRAGGRPRLPDPGSGLLRQHARAARTRALESGRSNGCAITAPAASSTRSSRSTTRSTPRSRAVRRCMRCRRRRELASTLRRSAIGLRPTTTGRSGSRRSSVPALTRRGRVAQPPSAAGRTAGRRCSSPASAPHPTYPQLVAGVAWIDHAARRSTWLYPGLPGARGREPPSRPDRWRSRRRSAPAPGRDVQQRLQAERLRRRLRRPAATPMRRCSPGLATILRYRKRPRSRHVTAWRWRRGRSDATSYLRPPEPAADRRPRPGASPNLSDGPRVGRDARQRRSAWWRFGRRASIEPRAT